MRLRSLELTRYGKFTDHRIDFGERDAGKPDLHIVYGPNEAGKSTALAAFLDLLFGIEPRSRFNFIHPYGVMRIGASLEIAGCTHDLVRIKRAQNDLLDRNDRPVAGGTLAGQLGGIDRDAYRSMFSLDDETLETGGESILASKGDLGELLFAASTGLADLSRALTALKAEADGFYRYHARTGELASLKARLAGLKEQREQIDTAASGYAQLIETRDRALAQYNEAITSRTAIQSRMDEIQRYAGALPRLADLRTLRGQLAPLAGLPVAPVGWREALPKLQEDEITIAVQLKSADDEVNQKSLELEAIADDPAALRLAVRVDRLAGLHARYLTADKDIPERRLEVREREIAIAGILGRIGRAEETDPRRLMFDAGTAACLQDLIAKRSGVEAATGNATKELAKAHLCLAEAEEKLGDGKDPGRNQVPLTGLAALVASLQTDDHAARRRMADHARTAGLEELADRLTALRPWLGDADQLAHLAVPQQSEIQQWKTELADAQKDNDLCEAEVRRLKTDGLRLEAEREAIMHVAGVLSDQDAGTIRACREAAWADHRRKLDLASADVFEAALRRDDGVMDARLRHEADLVRLNQTNERLLLAEADARRAQDLLGAAAVKLRGLQDQIAAAVVPMLPVGTTVVHLEAWLGKRDKALETRLKLKQAERDLRVAEADGEALRRRLIEALDAAEIKHDTDASVDALRSTAQGVIDRENELRALRVAVEERGRDVKARERALNAAAEREQEWQAAWLEASSKCWLGETELPLLPTAVGQIIPAVAALGHELEMRASLSDRVDKMLDDQRTFATEVSAIAMELGVATESRSPLDLARTIAEKVQQARAAETTHARTAKALEEARVRQRKLADERAIHAGRRAEMTDFFSVGSLAEVACAFSETERRSGLQSQADAAERDILDALRLASIEEAQTVLDSADRAALESELAELNARFGDQDQRSRDLFSVYSKSVDRVEAVGGDAAVAKIEEERRTMLLEIEDGAQRYLRLRVGIVAADHALRAYRQHHRSSMMVQASDAFRTISRHAYSGLTSQPNKDTEILIAVGADGSSKVASDLSKGTRFQLYLALRVAGYHEFARSRPPVPFIADDIMETFDDFRAEEAFRLLADMGDAGQVIYLTHHRHLCDIAHLVCPGVRVHDLTSTACLIG